MGALDGKIAIVTGTSRGVGVGIAHELLRAGATVIGCSMRDANREVWKFVAAALAVTVITALWPAMPLAIPRLFGF